MLLLFRQGKVGRREREDRVACVKGAAGDAGKRGEQPAPVLAEHRPVEAEPRGELAHLLGRRVHAKDAGDRPAAVRALGLPLQALQTRRWSRSARGALDLRGTLRNTARDPLCARVLRRSRSSRQPPLVMLIDISGSMDRYARVMLHFAHALLQGRERVNVFTFGTQLTDISRALRHRDPDEALAAAAQAVSDWSGGTRIGPCLETFTREHARRVLTGNAALLLVTDGLDRAEDGQLGQAAERLSRFAREFVWLNPLLRYEGFQPRASGVRALLPHVDHHLPVHSLDRLADLAQALRRGPPS